MMLYFEIQGYLPPQAPQKYGGNVRLYCVAPSLLQAVTAAMEKHPTLNISQAIKRGDLKDVIVVEAQ
jgi:hypothetical protein